LKDFAMSIIWCLPRLDRPWIPWKPAQLLFAEYTGLRVINTGAISLIQRFD
jgi:hypothetical protein